MEERFSVCSVRGKQITERDNLRDAFLAALGLLGGDPTLPGWRSTLVIIYQDGEAAEKVARLSWSKDSKLKIHFEPCSVPGFHWGYSFLCLFAENCYNYGFKAHDCLPVEEGAQC